MQVDPLTTALGFVHVQVERAFHRRWSVYAGPSLHLFPGILAKGPEPFVGFGAEVGVRRFFTGHAPEGFWVELRGVLAHLRTTDAAPRETAVGGYVSALAGYTAILGGWFVLAGGLGVQYLSYQVRGMGPRGVLPAAHTTVGVAF